MTIMFFFLEIKIVAKQIWFEVRTEWFTRLTITTVLGEEV